MSCIFSNPILFYDVNVQQGCPSDLKVFCLNFTLETVTAVTLRNLTIYGSLEEHIFFFLLHPKNYYNHHSNTVIQ